MPISTPTRLLAVIFGLQRTANIEPYALTQLQKVWLTEDRFSKSCRFIEWKGFMQNWNTRLLSQKEFKERFIWGQSLAIHIKVMLKPSVPGRSIKMWNDQLLKARLIMYNYPVIVSLNCWECTKWETLVMWPGHTDCQKQSRREKIWP